MIEVFVIVREGAVEEVTTPPGVRVIVRDYDDQEGGIIKVDDNGNEYREAIYE